MTFLDQRQMAGMTIEGRREYMHELLIERSRLTSQVEEYASPIGKRILQRKRDELLEIREQYVKIAINGVSDTDIVRSLIRWQAGELYLLGDIAAMESAENISEDVDKVIELCNDAITQVEKLSRTSR